MTDLKHYKMLILRFAYLHIYPGSGIEGLILLKPGFEWNLDSIVCDNLCELLKFAGAHVPHKTRSADEFNKWCNNGMEPTPVELEAYLYAADTLTPMPRPTPAGWEEVETDNG